MKQSKETKQAKEKKQPKNHRKTQKELIGEYLAEGNRITPIKAFRMFNCLRLSAVIFNLKAEGRNIDKDTVRSRSGEKSYASYYDRDVLDSIYD